MTENQPAQHEGIRQSDDEYKELILSLTKERGWLTEDQYQFQSFWCSSSVLPAVISFQKHFQARDSDIVAATLPKSGTTWLKALTFAIVFRHRFDIKTTSTHPLLTSNSHQLVPYFEFDLYANNRVPNFSSEYLDEPRLLATHLPFPSLGTVKESKGKIIYLGRNPSDIFVSCWHFFNKDRAQSQAPLLPLDEAFDMFYKGRDPFGPFWDHMLGYWKESLKRPQNVLFLKYEDMKEDVVLHLKRLAEFLDYPFTTEEESNGVIENIAKLCSYETMTNLEINKTGVLIKPFMKIENKNFFRKAEVGDWVNYFTPEMEERMSKLVEEKFGGSGLTFKVIPKLADPVQQN